MFFRMRSLFANLPFRDKIRLIGAACIILAAPKILALIIPLPARLSECPSKSVLFNDGIPAHVFLSCDGKWRMPVKLEHVDPRYTESLIQFEDKRFHWHFGLDPFALFRALAQNIKAGHTVSGGSTLTMQVVRVLEPRPRTLISKAIEAVRALQFELRFSKREIIEIYMQYAPFGKNIEGVAAASLAYYGHLPAELSPEQIAVLLAVPQSPADRFPDPKNYSELKKTASAIGSRLKERGVFKRHSLTPDFSNIPRYLKNFPRKIPHAAQISAADFRNRNTIRTTIDSGIQTLAEDILDSEKNSLNMQKINNAAVLILENSSGQIKAAIGNFDFWDEKHGGQIVGYKVPRSPGSTLKPFLYAMALEKGLALPETLLPDVPMNFAGFSPKNFDNKFSGLVSLETALSQSLNIPFVSLLKHIGVEEFLNKLRKMGVTSFSSQPERYGLSAIIGGLEVTPEELAGLYATLARNGKWKPVKWVHTDANEAPSATIFSEGSVWMVKKALSIRDRPDFPNRRSINDKVSGIRWKTGTSFGQRDAWAAGFNQNYTVVVWLGNFDNSASSALIGSESAAPVLFNLLEGLSGRSTSDDADLQPPDVFNAEVCSFSGLPATDACERRKNVHVLASARHLKSCPYHVKVDVDLQSGKALTQMCKLRRPHYSKVFMKLPVDVRRWITDTSQNLPNPPPVAESCSPPQSLEGPRIVSPAAGHTVLLIAGLGAEKQKVALEADLPDSSDEANWFLNGKYLGSTSGHDRLWWTPSAGEHELALTDGSGRTVSRRIRVKNHD
ncbi:MAG: penicillin-binding protein 1C [Proteobacteria bacterium]|nr:penicillin-binding protein 1C [Pseudomonadota bacterium]